jgi:exodeoxyribonuclease VII large subunit
MNNSSNDKYITVSELNNYIKLLFDNTSTLRSIALHGEISNFVGQNRSGHLYFSLKDDQSTIKAVMFKYDVSTLTFPPKDGDDVIVYGSVSSYPPNGTYQIIVKRIQLFGEGAILLKKQQLKEKLAKEGYFSEEHKVQLPKYPSKIGIITGKNSAACADMITNINRRFPLVNIYVYYSLVQGVESPMDIIKSLHKAIVDNVDIIIIGRGGGSLEDLEAFDDERLVKEIYNCKIPVISAVGHEINMSLCDLVADKYVSTPTGAAELAVPDKKDILDEISQSKSYLDSLINSKINEYKADLLEISKNKTLQNITYIYDKTLQELNNKKQSLNTQIVQMIDLNLHFVETKKKLLEAYNPINILNKGYSIVYDKNNKIVKSKSDVKSGDDLNIRVSDGNIYTIVKEK